MRRVTCLIFVVLGLANAWATAQTVPPALYHDNYFVPGIPRFGDGTLERTPQYALKKLRDARRALCAGRLFAAKIILFRDSQITESQEIFPFDHSKWIHDSQLMNNGTESQSAREVPLCDALGLYLRQRDYFAYLAAHAVHTRHGTAAADELDAEASLIKSLILLSADIPAAALKWALVAAKADANIPFASGLVESLEKQYGYSSKPQQVVMHKHVTDTRMEVWQGVESSARPLTILFEGKTGMFIGALVIERASSGGAARFVLWFRDLYGPPIKVRDYGGHRPSASKLLDFANTLRVETSVRHIAWTKVSEHGSLGGKVREPTVLRCELESLYWQRDRVWPLAAWWARQQPDSGALVRSLEMPLKQTHQWAWERKERFDISGSPTGTPFPGFSVIGFANTELEDAQSRSLLEREGALQHYHFVVIPGTGNSAQYLFSYVVTSRLVVTSRVPNITGERLYFLQRLVDGDLEEVKLFDGLDPPDYETARREVQRILFQYAAGAMGVEFNDESPTTTLAKSAQRTAARETGQPVAIKNSIGMRMCLIPSGAFRMGSPEMEFPWRMRRETQHVVRITQPFYLGAYEVTQGQYERVMGANPSYYSPTGRGKDKMNGVDTRHYPVENVTWQDAREFCRRLSNLPGEQAAGRAYRLPTEAEWEYACRALTTTRFSAGYSAACLKDTANTYDQSYQRARAYLKIDAAWDDGFPCTAPVGQFQPNAWGLFDMYGNVDEMCRDVWDWDYYRRSPMLNPAGPAEIRYRLGWFHAQLSQAAGEETSDAYRLCEEHVTRGGADFSKCWWWASGSAASKHGNEGGFRVLCSLPSTDFAPLVNEAVGFAGNDPKDPILHIVIPEFAIKGRYWVYVDGKLLRGEFGGLRYDPKTHFHDTGDTCYVFNGDDHVVYRYKKTEHGSTIDLYRRDLAATRTISVVVNSRGYPGLDPGTHRVELVALDRQYFGAIEWEKEQKSDSAVARHLFPFVTSVQEVSCAAGKETDVVMPLPVSIRPIEPVSLVRPGLDFSAARRKELARLLEEQATDPLIQFLNRMLPQVASNRFSSRVLFVPVSDKIFSKEYGFARFMDGAQLRIMIDWWKHKEWVRFQYAVERDKNLGDVLAEVARQIDFVDRFYEIADAMDAVPQ